jgi:hypothetical protein
MMKSKDRNEDSAMSKPSIVLSAALIVLTSALFAAQRAFADGTGLELQIQAIKSKLIIAEPAVISLKVTNTSSQPIQVCPDFKQVSESITFFVAKGDRGFHAVSLGVVKDPAAPPLQIAPGDSVYKEEILLADTMNKSNLAFSEPGDFKVYAQWYCGAVSKIIVSNTIVVTVTAPTGDALPASHLAATTEVIRAFQDLSRSKEAISSLKSLATGSSVYAPYAAYKLAQTELRSSEFGLAQEESLRKEKQRLERAQALLEIADKPDFAMRHAVLLGKGRIALDREQFQQAKEIFESIQRDYRETSAAGKSKEILDSMAAKPAAAAP